jgi:hypothetical protein
MGWVDGRATIEPADFGKKGDVIPRYWYYFWNH